MQNERMGKGKLSENENLAQANLCRMREGQGKLIQNEALAKVNLCRMREGASEAFTK